LCLKKRINYESFLFCNVSHRPVSFCLARSSHISPPNIFSMFLSSGQVTDFPTHVLHRIILYKFHSGFSKKLRSLVCLVSKS
jgi:hypothetical protein